MKRGKSLLNTALSIVILLLITMLILAVPAVSSDEKVDISAKIVKNEVLPKEWAEFIIKIDNQKLMDDTFFIDVPSEGIEWSALTKPQADMYGKRIRNRALGTIDLLLKDLGLERSVTKKRPVEIHLVSERTGESYSLKLPIYLWPESMNNSLFEANFDVTTDFPKFIDPRKKYSFKVNIKNNNLKIYEDMKVSLKSRLIDQESVIDLEPNQAKTIDFTVEFDPKQRPVRDELSLGISGRNTVYYLDVIPLEISSYQIPFEKSSDSSGDFLLVAETVKFTNTENIEDEQDVMIEKKPLDFVITSMVPEPNVGKVEGKAYFMWKARLKPGESFSITIEKNYRLVLYGVIIIGLLIFFYYMFKSPIKIRKQVEMVRTMQGGIMEMKVVVSVANLTAENFKRVKLIERFPHLVTMLRMPEHEHQGTLAPVKSVSTHHGSVVYWEFDMGPYEERLVMYKLRSSLSILGDMRLPPAVLKYTMKDHSLSLKSNELDISSERV